MCMHARMRRLVLVRTSTMAGAKQNMRVRIPSIYIYIPMEKRGTHNCVHVMRRSNCVHAPRIQECKLLL